MLGPANKHVILPRNGMHTLLRGMFKKQGKRFYRPNISLMMATMVLLQYHDLLEVMMRCFISALGGLMWILPYQVHWFAQYIHVKMTLVPCFLLVALPLLWSLRSHAPPTRIVCHICSAYWRHNCTIDFYAITGGSFTSCFATAKIIPGSPGAPKS